MRQFKPTIKTIGENRFYIRPFPAFTAAKMTGDLAAMTTIPNPTILKSRAFIQAIAEKLDA